MSEDALSRTRRTSEDALSLQNDLKVEGSGEGLLIEGFNFQWHFLEAFPFRAGLQLAQYLSV